MGWKKGDGEPMNPKTVEAMSQFLQIATNNLRKAMKSMSDIIDCKREEFYEAYAKACIKHGSPRIQKCARIYLTTKNSRIQNKQLVILSSDFLQRILSISQAVKKSNTERKAEVFDV
jgi:hypothetical protein